MVLKWGLIGAGDIARKRVAPALLDLPNCELVSISRSRSDLAEAFAKEFGVRKWFADWREQITDDEIDAVYIATPVYLHADQTIAAANAGKHVLCEKPMALDTKECNEMIAACMANNVKLGIAYYRRFYPLIVRVREIIQAGEIGRITVAQINAFEYFDPPPDHPRRWLLDRSKSGGGPLIDFGCHRIEILTHLFGAIVQNEAIVSNEIFSREVEDTVSVLLRFENSVSASVTVTHAAIEPQDTLDIYGTRGSIHILILNGSEMTIRSGGDARVEIHKPTANVHQPLIEDFTSSVLSGREPQVDGETGREVSRLIEDIYQRKGQEEGS
ncbi:MAG: Gfo/Idh/MocA family oxidoreductase [Acidobacteriota bacterium]